MTPVSYNLEKASNPTKGATVSNIDVAPSQTRSAVSSEASDIARQFVGARQAGKSLPGFPGPIPSTLADAYQVQDAAIALFSQSVGGWKVGRIFPPQSDQYGANRLAGPIFKPAIQRDSGTGVAGRIFAGGFGAAEAELLLHIGRQPPPGKMNFTLEEAAEFIDKVHVGIEIASSPLATINDLGPPVIISDFGNNNGLIVGPEIANWRSADIDQIPVHLAIDGAVVGQGSAAAFPDGTLGSVRFLFELMARRSIALAPGTWISSGALTGVHDVSAGQRVEASYGLSNGSTATVACTVTHATAG